MVRSVPLLGVVLILSGCAMLKNTPQQERAFAIFDACKTETSSLTANLTHVAPDGSFHWTSREGNEFSSMRACLSRKGSYPMEAGSIPPGRPGGPPLETRAPTIARAIPPAVTAPAASRPTLEVGQRWQRTDGALEVKERTATGYVLEVGDKRYDVTFDGDLREVRVKGAVVVRYDPPFPLFQWPIRVGHVWSYSGRLLNRATAFDGDVKDRLTVEAYEDVRVPAGTFPAFRIAGQSFRYWYSPALGTVVKHEPVRSDARLERFELVSVALPPRLALPAVPGDAPAPGVTVPILVSNNLVLVSVTFNGSHGATLLLDTGASHTIITPALAKRLGVVLPASPVRRQVKLVGGREIDLPFVRLSSVVVGTAERQGLEVGVYEVQPDAPLLDGLLGADFLHHYRVTIDQQDRQLRLEPKP